MATNKSCFEAPVPCTEKDSRLPAFRKLVSDISEHLSQDEVAKFSFIQHVPDKNASALAAFNYLLRKGVFSHNNVEPLATILKNIDRHDLLTQLVEPYKDNYPQGKPRSFCL